MNDGLQWHWGALTGWAFLRPRHVHVDLFATHRRMHLCGGRPLLVLL